MSHQKDPKTIKWGIVYEAKDENNEMVHEIQQSTDDKTYAEKFVLRENYKEFCDEQFHKWPRDMIEKSQVAKKRLTKADKIKIIDYVMGKLTSNYEDELVYGYGYSIVPVDQNNDIIELSDDESDDESEDEIVSDDSILSGSSIESDIEEKKKSKRKVLKSKKHRRKLIPSVESEEEESEDEKKSVHYESDIEVYSGKEESESESDKSEDYI
jgi:hypothetical protein